MLVPQELVDLIVGNLEGDTPALKSCSLAARTFVRASQTYLFQRIEILPPAQPQKSGDTPCQRLYKVLTSSPHLAAHVDELCIVVVGSETSFDYDENWDYIEKRQPPWVMSNRTLSLVLPLLNLKRFSMVENSPIDWNEHGRYSMNWGKLGRFSKSALITVFSSPKLESVHLRGLVIHSPRELLSLFSDATSLTSLSLSRIYYDRPSDNLEWLDSKPWHARLTSLLLSELGSSSWATCRSLNGLQTCGTFYPLWRDAAC